MTVIGIKNHIILLKVKIFQLIKKKIKKILKKNLSS